MPANTWFASGALVILSSQINEIYGASRPESLQLSSFRDDSRLSNLTPTIAYTPETFLIEQEENEEDNFE